MADTAERKKQKALNFDAAQQALKYFSEHPFLLQDFGDTSIVNAMPFGYSICLPTTGLFVFVNNHYAHTLGYEPEEIMGHKTFYDFSWIEDERELPSIDQLKFGTVPTLRKVYQRKDGRTIGGRIHTWVGHSTQIATMRVSPAQQRAREMTALEPDGSLKVLMTLVVFETSLKKASLTSCNQAVDSESTLVRPIFMPAHPPQENRRTDGTLVPHMPIYLQGELDLD